MDYKEKAEFLKEYRKAMKLKKSFEAQLVTARAAVQQAKSQVLSDMPRSPSRKNNDLSAIMVKLEKVEVQLHEKQLECLRRYSVVAPAIMELEEPNEQLVLQKRYAESKKWTVIMDEMQYEWSRIHDIHKSAINNLKI